MGEGLRDRVRERYAQVARNVGDPGGFPLEHFAAKMRGEDPGSLPPFELAAGPMVLGAVRLRIEGGRTVEIERVDW